MSYSTNYFQAVTDAIKHVRVFDRGGVRLDLDAAIARLLDATSRVQEAGSCLWFAGNGASAAMASHMALDFSKNAKVRSQAMNDMAAVTALANDLGYENIFGQPLMWHGQDRDGVVLVSSSGGSPNMLRAAEAARTKGMWVVTLTGLEQDNPLSRLGDLNFFVDARTYGIVECAHQVLLHMWLDQFMGVEEWSTRASQNMRLTS